MPSAPKSPEKLAAGKLFQAIQTMRHASDRLYESTELQERLRARRLEDWAKKCGSILGDIDLHAPKTKRKPSK